MLMRDLGTNNAQDANTRKIDAFFDYLVEESPVEKWFHNLQAGVNAATTWSALEATFHIQFPEKVERTAQEWERELASMKLMLAELGTTVKVGRADVFAHVHFASRLLEVARLVGIANTTNGIWQSQLNPGTTSESHSLSQNIPSNSTLSSQTTPRPARWRANAG
ncbi:hypothetical protein B0H17DRAFT_1209276 [Mycena rosella]|uniref:Retrotransposon gag domain-containing protein n=1 Tax=Mycena rosella TaxID=1033263 RepID=A0AAD7G9U3_MYCRO|nr:hypothetical protein B0H17DRAFT_1209276 [Mycena rosella]